MEKENQTQSPESASPEDGKKKSPLSYLSNIFDSREARQAQAEVDQLEASLKAAAEEFDTVTRELTEANHQIESLESEIATLKADLSARDKSIAALQGDVQKAEKSAGAKAAQIAAENNADVTDLPEPEPSEKKLSPVESAYERFKAEKNPIKKGQLARELREMRQAAAVGQN